MSNYYKETVSTTVVSSAARTATGQGSVFTTGNGLGTMGVLLNATAVSGTSPTMTVAVQWSHDGGTTWFSGDPVDQFTATTAAGAAARSFQVKAPYARITWTIGGTTPSFTFSVVAVTTN